MQEDTELGRYLPNKLDDVMSEIYLLRKQSAQMRERINELEKRVSQVTAVALSLAVIVPVILESILKS